MQSAAVQVSTDRSWLLKLEGLRIGSRFEVTRRLGCGSYSEIYLAHNLAPRIGEPNLVVIKALSLLLQGTLEPDLERTLIENIELEAHTLHKFNHEHVIRLFGYGRALDHDDKQFYYLVMEYLQGGALNTFCYQRPLSIQATLGLTQQICSALSYVHRLRVLHRDVKPNNIMLSQDQRTLKLVDFGTARLLDNTSGFITRVGTDVYAAPEHYSLAEITLAQLTPAADIYGTAKSVYYMLCGTPPSAFKQRPITDFPVSLQKHEWAEGVLGVLSRATQESPRMRHQSAQEFYDDLLTASDLTALSPKRFHNPVSRGKLASRVVVEMVSKSQSNSLASSKALPESPRRKPRRLINFLASYSQVLRRVVKSLSMKPLKRVATLVIVLLISLAVLFHVLNLWRSRQTAYATREGTATGQTSKHTIASTDINIRSAPNSKAQKVGLAERGSMVRILSSTDVGQWCEIQVIRHGREKETPSSADRGWLNRKYLRSD